MAEQDRGVGHGQPHNGPEHTPRLRLKRKAPTTGFVDGAWWPRSNDLCAELPDLLAVLSVRLGDISRVIFNRAEWSESPRKFLVDNQLIKLDGYDRQPINTVGVVDSHGDNVILLVVPVQTSDEDAHSMMESAALADGTTTVATLLAPSLAQ